MTFVSLWSENDRSGCNLNFFNINFTGPRYLTSGPTQSIQSLEFVCGLQDNFVPFCELKHRSAPLPVSAIFRDRTHIAGIRRDVPCRAPVAVFTQSFSDYHEGMWLAGMVGAYRRLNGSVDDYRCRVYPPHFFFLFSEGLTRSWQCFSSPSKRSNE